MGRLVSKILNKIYVDRAVEKAGLKSILEKIGFKIRMSRALGFLITWFLYAVILIATAEILNLHQISSFLQAVKEMHNKIAEEMRMDAAHLPLVL